MSNVSFLGIAAPVVGSFSGFVRGWPWDSKGLKEDHGGLEQVLDFTCPVDQVLGDSHGFTCTRPADVGILLATGS